MKTARIIDILPQCYSLFLPPFFKNPIPIESAATCRNCAMQEKPDSHTHASINFSSKTKCCTYHPEIPNYLVGALMSSVDPEHATGRQRMLNRIAGKTSISPLGVFRPKKLTLLTRNANLEYFGRSEFLRCPFHDDEGFCTVMPYWDAVCSTWFCKHDAGEEGWRFWRTLRTYLENLQKILSRYVLLKIDFKPPVSGISIDASAPLTLQELDDLPPPEPIYRQSWGAWAGHETEFYTQSYTMISQLSQDEFARIEGIEQKLLLRELEQAYGLLTTTSLPERSKRNPALTSEKISESSYLLSGYSPFDPLKISKRLYDCLDLFDGSLTNQQVIQLCHEQHEVRLPEEILKKLHRFRILVAEGETK